MIREQFFQDVTALPQRFSYIWEDVLKYEDATGKSLDTMTTFSEYVALLDSIYLWDLSAFLTARTCVSTYVRYLVEHQVLPREAEMNLARVQFQDLIPNSNGHIDFFRNTAVLQEAVEYTLTMIPPKVADDTVYCTAICALFLAWAGLTESEIIEVRKDDITPEGAFHNGQQLDVSAYGLAMLNRFRVADGYYRKGRGLIFRPYVDSEFLFRSDVSKQINVANLRTATYKFHKVSNQELSLLHPVVYRSGVFHRAYMQELQSLEFPLQDREFAENVFCEKLQSQFRHRNVVTCYQRYKKLFA